MDTPQHRGSPSRSLSPDATPMLETADHNDRAPVDAVVDVVSEPNHEYSFVPETARLTVDEDEGLFVPEVKGAEGETEVAMGKEDLELQEKRVEQKDIPVEVKQELGINEIPKQMEQDSKMPHLDDVACLPCEAPSPSGKKRAPTKSNEKPASKKKRDRKVPPYDDLLEKETSRLAVDQPVFAAAKKLVAALCKTVCEKYEALADQGFSDPYIKKIIDRTQELQFLRKSLPPYVIAGFLGDTAVGKSSLINCLVNRSNTVGESDEGDSGTHVVQELAPRAFEQTDAFMAIVYYPPQRKIDGMVERHFNNVLACQETERSGLDASELHALDNKYNTALDFFLTLLCDSTDFSSRDKAKDWFALIKDKAQQEGLQALKRKVAEYRKLHCHGDGATVFRANNIEEINHRLRPFKGPIKPTSDGTLVSSPWVIVEKIVLHMEAGVLGEDLILADLPGTSDTNKTRVEATRDYIMKCDWIVIPHPILRIQAQESFWSNVREIERAGKSGSTILVATKIDDMKIDRDRDLEDDEQARLDAFKDRVLDLQAQIEELEEAAADVDSDDEDPTRQIRLDKQLKQLRQLKNEAEAKRYEENILARNRRNHAAIAEKYREKFRTWHTPKVEFVSNLIYGEHMKGYDIANPPKLSLQATGVPGLRHFLRSCAASRRRDFLIMICSRRLPRLLLGLEMQCSRTRLEMKAAVKQRLEEPLLELPALVSRMKLSASSLFTDNMELLVNSHEHEWKRKAEAQHDAWMKYGYQRYAAFCRHDGNWKNKQKEDEFWTGTICDIAADEITLAFRNIYSGLGQLKRTFKHEIEQLLEKVNKELKDSPELMAEDLSRFDKGIVHVREDVAAAVDKDFVKLESAIKNIAYDASSISAEDSYLLAIMQTVYETCKSRIKTGGTGVFNDIKKTLSNRLHGPQNIYLELLQDAVAAYDEELDAWSAEVHNKVDKELNTIIEMFDQRYADDEPDKDGQNRLHRKALLRTVQEVVVRNEDELEPVVTKLKSFD